MYPSCATIFFNTLANFPCLYSNQYPNSSYSNTNFKNIIAHPGGDRPV